MITEIVGLAGVGKTTLSLALAGRNPTVRCGFALHPLAFIPAFLIKAVLSLPGRWLRRHQGQQISWETLRIMVYLEKLYRVLSRYSRDGSTFFFLDQGPVFLLAYLQQFGFEDIADKDQKLELWRQSMLDRWAAVLDVIFWVDAQDTVLLQRIRQRDSWHRVKDLSEQKAREFLTRYRETYQQIILQFTSQGKTRVIHFFSDQESMDQIINRIIEELGVG